MTQPLRRLLAALVLVVAAAACAAEAGTSFDHGFTEAAERYDERLTALTDAGRDALEGEETSELLPVYEQLADATAEVLTALADLEPPASQRDEFRRVVDGMTRQDEVLDRVIDAARAEDTEGLAAAVEDLGAAVTEATAAQHALKMGLGRRT